MGTDTKDKKTKAKDITAKDLLEEKLGRATQEPCDEMGCDATVDKGGRNTDEAKGDDGEDRDDTGRLKKPIEQYSSAEIGEEGERLAASYLERRGFEVLERNWTCEAGEVDIVAKDVQDNTVVLVEVKTRLALGEDCRIMPELAVDEQKQNRYRKMALLYLATHMDCYSIRFDVIALNIVGERMAKLRHLLGAFSWDE